MSEVYKGMYDYMPGIYGSDYSFGDIRKLLKRYSKEYDDLAVCLMDINNFKMYNFMFGYEFGDRMLSFVFNNIKRCIHDRGYIYRFGEQFLIVLLQKTNYENEFLIIIEEIMNMFNNPIKIKECELSVLVDMGIALYPDNSEKIEDVLKYAEIALSQAKKACPKRYKFFESQMYDELIKKEKVNSDLLSAMRNNEFILYYQPVIDINTMKINGAEALLRWKHPQWGILSPGCFIDIIEKSGIIKEIGKFVFCQACCQLQKWRSMGYKDLSMSINISERQLEDDSFEDFIEKVIANTKIDPHYIKLEITERVLVNATEKNKRILSKLSNKGVKIFIDDFGTKYSSIGYLFQFPIGGIKIDKSFIDKLNYSERNVAIIKNMVKCANEINIDIVAEGVETNEQLECLKECNCREVQGYIFSKPVSPDDFVKFAEKSDMLLNNDILHIKK